MRESIVENENGEESVKRLFINIVKMIRNHTNICLVGFSDIPNNVPEVYELKINKVNQLMELGNQISAKFNIDFLKSNNITHILGPAMMSMLISHFTHKNFISLTYQIEFNEEYYETYSNTLAELLLYGITGFSNQKNH